jgi:ABC-type multidrug transport system fused ATPase/permease subunit
LHVVRQSWPFFQNDFAGRIANRVMQTSNAVRESVVSCIRAVWYIVVYGLSALVLMSTADWRLAIPTALWFVGYVVTLRHFVPPMRDLARSSSELRSQVMGRVVDSYTNILTVKLFARARDEDQYVREVIDAGVGYIPENRSKDGLVGDFTIAENFMINRSYGPPFAKGLSIDFASRERIAADLIQKYDVRTPSQLTLAKKLSGGNQQKVVVARELSRDLNLLIASQPTRGVDVGSIEFIHERIIATRDAGKPVVIISTELDEVTALADRIAVMYRGRIVGIVDAKTPRETLGRMMAGATV